MIERFQKITGFWVNLHPVIRFFVGILVLVLIGWWVARPSYRAGKVWWYGRQLDQAQAAVASGDMQKAKDLSQTILRAGDPRVIEALRILEKSMTALRDPNRMQIANALLFHPKGDQDDHLRGFLLNVEDSPLGFLGKIWVHIDKEDQLDRRFALPFAERLLDSGKLSEVLAVVQALEGWDKSWDTQSLVLRALIADDQKESLTQAQQKFEEWWPADQHESGLAILERIPVLKLDVTLLPNSIKRLRPEAGRDFLMLTRMQYVADKWKRLELVDQAIRQWKDAVPMDLAKFLIATGMNYHMISAFPPEFAGKHNGMLELMLSACVTEKEHQKALDYLAAGEKQLAKEIFLAWKFAMLAKLQREEELSDVQGQLSSAISSSSQTNVYLSLAKVMKAAELPDLANEYLFDAIKTGKGPLPLFADISGLIASLAAKGLEKSLLEVISSYLLFEPSNPMLVANYSYLACIAKSCDPTVLVNVMEPLAKAFPDSPHISAILAAIYLAAGDYGKAQKLAELVKTDLQKIGPGYRAAILFTRYKAGLIEANDKQLTNMPWAQMMPVEVTFYQGFLGD